MSADRFDALSAPLRILAALTNRLAPEGLRLESWSGESDRCVTRDDDI